MDFSVRSRNVHNIVNILMKDAVLVKENIRFHNALGLPYANVQGMVQQTLVDGSGIYGFLTSTFHNWISANGQEASIQKLTSILKAEGFNKIAEELLQCRLELCEMEYVPPVNVNKKNSTTEDILITKRIHWKTFVNENKIIKITENFKCVLGFLGTLTLELITQPENAQQLNVCTYLQSGQDFYYKIVGQVIQIAGPTVEWDSGIERNVRHRYPVITKDFEISWLEEHLISEWLEIIIRVVVFTKDYPIYNDPVNELATKCTKCFTWHIDMEEFLKGKAVKEFIIGYGFQDHPTTFKFITEVNANGDYDISSRVLETHWSQVLITLGLKVVNYRQETIAFCSIKLHDATDAVRLLPSFIKKTDVETSQDGITVRGRLTIYGRNAKMCAYSKPNEDTIGLDL